MPARYRRLLCYTLLTVSMVAIAGLSVTYLEGLNEGDSLEAAARRSRDLRGFSAPDSVWIWADLDGYDLSKANLRRSVLDYGSFAQTILDDADLREARLSYCDLLGARARRARFHGAQLHCSRLSSADFRGSVLREANLERVHAIGTDFRDADLTNANLAVTFLDGADFRGAELSGADLEGAQYTESTQWPEAFDPKAAGAVLMLSFPDVNPWTPPGRGYR